MASSQDHKARDNGDLGPNTGGMGAYSPAPVVTPELHQRIMTEVIEPTVRGMVAEGRPYVGFLYAGLMISSEGIPKVLEYNCRFGDPEAQPIMLRLRSDLVELCEAALAGQLNKVNADWDERAALGVVLAAKGYPGTYPSGDAIAGLAQAGGDSSKLFHAGTQRKDDQIVTTGGRVLCATALGDTVLTAQQRAYELARQVCWKNIYYRTDIGYRAIERERNKT
jgi:phosphoribosylamine--glycine ligase